MSQRANCKLVLKARVGEVEDQIFRIVKSVNTLDFGIPGDTLTREEVNRILIDKAYQIKAKTLVVEFLY